MFTLTHGSERVDFLHRNIALIWASGLEKGVVKRNSDAFAQYADKRRIESGDENSGLRIAQEVE